jgi:hypothetical protein
MADRAAQLNMELPAKAKGERTKPRWQNEGQWWTLDDAGKPTPLVDPQTGKQMVNRGAQLGTDLLTPQQRASNLAISSGRAIAQSDKGVEDSNRIADITDNNSVIDEQIARRQPDLDAAKRELSALEQASKAVSATGIVVDDSKRLERARKKVQDIQSEIDSLQRQKKVVPQPRVGASRSMPKLNEQAIRDAATKAGLDPNVAIQRAKARGQL